MTIDAVIEPVLVEAIRRACHLGELRAGRHIRRDYRGWKTGATTVDRLWIAEIKPTFLDAACLAVLTIDQRRFAIFTRGTWTQLDALLDFRGRMRVPAARPSVTVIVAGPYGLDATWVDPVAAVLQRSDAWPEPRTHKNRVTLDGVGYSVFVETLEAQVAVRFANPRMPALRALEAALVQVAHTLTERDVDGVIAEYVGA